MSEEFYTVEAAAHRLKLHPKTVLRFIREGRLRATKVGRQYRIFRSDLGALLGEQMPAPASARGARATAILDIPHAGAELARRMAALLTGVHSGNDVEADTLSIDIIHDPSHSHLKVIAVGSPADTAQLLRLAQVLLEN